MSAVAVGICEPCAVKLAGSDHESSGRDRGSKLAAGTCDVDTHGLCIL